jgi:SAM-dependent methyltransferase
MFDVVVSQFGHMFAPRPEVVISEMLRVLRPGGTIAFSTWPPEMFTGRMFALTGKYFPPPEGVAPPPLWGDPKIIRERLGAKVSELTFERDMVMPPTLSPQHFRTFIEGTVGPIIKLIQSCPEDDPKLKSFRSEFDALITEYFGDNHVRQHFIMSRALRN